MPFAISPRDRALLAALFDPYGCTTIAAGCLGMDEPELLAWFDRPDIKQLVKTERRLRRLKREIKLEAMAMDMLESLQELVHTTEDQVEKRRAATTVMRAIIHCGAGFQPARPSKSEIRDSKSSYDPIEFYTPIAQSLRDATERFKAERREEDQNPLSAATLAKIDAGQSVAIPDRFSRSPRDLLERVADRLSLSSPTPPASAPTSPSTTPSSCASS